MKRLYKLASLVTACVAWLMSTTSVAAAATPDLRVNKQSLFVVPAPVANLVDIVDVLQVVNDSGTARNIQLFLPTDAKSVQVEGDAHHQLRPVHGSLTLPKWARPHTGTQVTVSFVLPFDESQGKQFTLHTQYPIATSQIYLALGNTALSAEDVQVATQSVTISGTKFRVFTRMGIPANDDWTMSLQALPVATSGQSVIRGLPVIGTDDSSEGNTLQALLNLVLAAFVLVIGLISIRSTQWAGQFGRRLSTREALYRAWEKLELDFEEGRIAKDRYLQQRGQLKQRLVELGPQGTTQEHNQC